MDRSHIKYAYLDGTTKDRQKQVKLFQENEEISVFLISLKAGGLGLNLTAADYVFLLDPWLTLARDLISTEESFMKSLSKEDIQGILA